MIGDPVARPGSHDREGGVSVTTAASRWRRTLIAMALPMLLVLGACSTESALCQSVDSLDEAVQGMEDVNVTEDGVDALTTQIDAVKSSFADVKSEAGD
jgi:hypothetical protein